MTEQVKLTHITRVIDPKTGIHYLDGIDDQGRHWMAQMSHRVEPWLCYTVPWYIGQQRPYS